jgi:Flp pilus assembly protein TadD
MRNLMACLVAGALALTVPATAAGGGGGGGSMPSAPSGPQVDLRGEYKSGLEALGVQNYKKAIKHFRTVTGGAPKLADAHNWLGYSYRKSGDKKAALKSYLKALKLEPNHAGANEYLGELYLEQKDLPKAEERMAVLNSCCAATSQAKQLADALTEYKSGGTFTAKAPLLSY